MSNKQTKEMVNRYKTQPCKDCGIQYNPWIMHFDHRDPSIKLFTIGDRGNKCIKDVINEIKKCDVICSNCHAERSYRQFKAGVFCKH